MSRLEIVLHGRQHWVRGLLGLGLAVMILGLMFRRPGRRARGGIDMQRRLEGWRGKPFLQLDPASCSRLITATVQLTVWFTQREQALLALLPGVPQRRTLNRWVLAAPARRDAVGVWAGACPIRRPWRRRLTGPASSPCPSRRPARRRPAVAAGAGSLLQGQDRPCCCRASRGCCHHGPGRSGLVEMSGWVTVTELNLACVVLTALIAAWGYPHASCAPRPHSPPGCSTARRTLIATPTSCRKEARTRAVWRKSGVVSIIRTVETSRSRLGHRHQVGLGWPR